MDNSQEGARTRDDQVVSSKKLGCSAILSRRASLSSVRELSITEVNCDRVPSWGVDSIKGSRTSTATTGALQSLPSIRDQESATDSYQSVSSHPVPLNDGDGCKASLKESSSTQSPYLTNIHSTSSPTDGKQTSTSLKRPYPFESEDKFPSIISVDRREDANGRIVLKLKVPSLYYSSQTSNTGDPLQRNSRGFHRKKKRRKHRKHRFEEDISEHGMSLRKQKPTLMYTDTQIVTEDDRKLKWSLRSNISQVSRFSEEYIDVSLYKRNFREKQAPKRSREAPDLNELIESYGVTPIYVHTKLNNSLIEEVICEEYSSHEKQTVKQEQVNAPIKERHVKKRKKKRKRKKRHLTEAVLSEKASESLLVTDTLVSTQCSLPKEQPGSPLVASEDAEPQPEENFPLLLASLRAPTESSNNIGTESDKTEEIAKEIIMGKQTSINEVTIEKISPILNENNKAINLSTGPSQEPLDLKRRIENKVTIEKVSDTHQSSVTCNEKISEVLITPVQTKPDSVIPLDEANSDKPKKETLLSVLLQQNNKSTPSITFQPVQGHLPYRERTPPLHDRMPQRQQKKTPPTVRVAPVMKEPSQPSTCHLLKQYLSTGPSKKESECEVVYSGGRERPAAPTDAMRMMFPHPAETNAAFMRYFTEINRYHMEWLEWVHKSQSSHSYSEPVIYNPFRYPLGEPEVPTLQPEVPVTNWKIRIPPKEKPSSSETSERAVPPLIPIKKSTS